MTGGGSSGGGGGGSGKISWPKYFMELHERWLDTGLTPYDSSDDDQNSEVSMEQALWEAWDNSPFGSAYTSDPTDDIAVAEAAFTAANALITAIDIEGDFEDYVTKAIAQVDDAIATDSIKQDDVDNFEKLQLNTHLRALGRFSSGMSDANAVSTSSYVLGMAFMERDFAQSIADYASKVTLAMQQQRPALITNAVSSMIQLLSKKLELSLQYANQITEMSRVKIIAVREYYDRDLELTVKDHLWNLEIWQNPGNLLAAAQGGVTPTRTQEQGSKSGGGLTSMLGGAMGGMGSGALVGQELIPIPGVGAAIGAVAGGLFGGATA